MPYIARFPTVNQFPFLQTKIASKFIIGNIFRNIRFWKLKSCLSRFKQIVIQYFWDQWGDPLMTPWVNHVARGLNIYLPGQEYRCLKCQKSTRCYCSKILKTSWCYRLPVWSERYSLKKKIILLIKFGWIRITLIYSSFRN